MILEIMGLHYIFMEFIFSKTFKILFCVRMGCFHSFSQCILAMFAVHLHVT